MVHVMLLSMLKVFYFTLVVSKICVQYPNMAVVSSLFILCIPVCCSDTF